MGPIRIRVDNRVRVVAGDGPGDVRFEVCAELAAAFTHTNPAAHGDRYAADEPATYKTYQVRSNDGGPIEYSFPRGGMGRVREVLRRYGLAWEVEDARTWAHPEPGLPDHRVALWPHQERLVAAATARQNCILTASTGCLTGETWVTINRAGKGAKMRLAHVVHMFNGGTSSNRIWDAKIPTFVRAPFADGSVRLDLLLAAKESGKRPVYTVTTIGGRTLSATEDHLFSTPFGWVPLSDVSVGDWVLCDGGIQTGVARRPWYKVKELREHPYAGRRKVVHSGWTVPLHRLLAEARDNGMTLEEFEIAVRQRRAGLKFLDPKKWVVHHLDENPRNNALGNLEVVTHEQHRLLHLDHSLRNISSRLVPDEVESIEYAGEHETFDLCVERSSAFIANGLAVHNSGKTTAGLALVARLKRRSLVMVWTGALEKQWRERIADELGLHPSEIGRFRGGHREIRPITVAMQQTVVSALAAGEELAGEFDVVICDEVQRFAAPTLFASVDPFGAKYRIGISADHTRQDRKEFLTHDLFGDVAEAIAEAEVVSTGVTVEVEVCVVPTGFAAPWYRYRQDFNRLLAQMTADEARNRVALELAAAEVRAGEQVLLFTHRVEHARQLDAALAALGISSGVMTGGADNQEVFARTKAGLRSGEVRAAVGTYQAIAQGVDLPSVSRGVCVTPIANNRQQVGQVCGRLCRSHAASGKTAGRLYYLLDQPIYQRRPVTNFLKWGRRVLVRDRDAWVDGAEYLRRVRARAA